MTAMPDFTPQDPDFERRVRDSFSCQAVMATIGARLVSVVPGEATLAMPYREDLTQQNGFLHAGIMATVLDSACGYAAYTLMPADADILSIEFKINLLAPARGDEIVAVGRVIKAGRTITVCTGDAYALVDGDRKHVASMNASMIAVPGR
jgi:uncharacterized protein (TIGR00369 family)